MVTIKQRMDSWASALTGLGDALRDKAESVFFRRVERLTDTTCLNLYHQEDLAARICNALPRAGLRPGFSLSADEEDIGLVGALDEYSKTVGFRKALRKCAIWARVLGGACIYVGVDDGQGEDQPINDEAIRRISFVSVLDKRTLIPHTYYDSLERYGEIETYQVQQIFVGNPLMSAKLATGTIIHESRLIRMDGTLTEDLRMIENSGWSYSVLERPNVVLRDFGASWKAVGHLMQDASQAVFKIQGLTEMLAGGQKDTLSSRMQLVDMSRSIARAIMVDADHEEFRRESYNFSGLSDVLNQSMIRLAAAAEMPVTVLFGQSPKGLNATGESDIRLWYDSVGEYQQDELTPAIERFWTLVFAADDFDGEAPDTWSVKFGKLWQPSESEQADIEKKVADRDKIYIDAGVLLPEEVAVNRFRASGFSMETQIDLDAREEMREAELELAVTKAGEEPEPPPMQPGGQPPPEGGTPPEPEPGRVDRQDRIEKRGSSWIVTTESGRVLGKHRTKKEALRQLRAVEAAKHA